MARLYVFAEGQTEQEFFREVVDPHLQGRGVWLQRLALTATSFRAGGAHRGGVRAYAPARKDIWRHLREDGAPDAYLTTMIDLYRLPEDFPGYQDSRHLRARDRVAALEQAFADDMADPRFIPYIQLHEFEACILADPDKLAVLYEDAGSAIATLRGVVATHGSPELVNDGPNTHPAQRIVDLIPQYDKVAGGAEIAAEIGLARIRQECPHFNDWISRLEALGSAG